MQVGRRHDIVGDASAKALGHRAEWCVKGTLVTLPPLSIAMAPMAGRPEMHAHCLPCVSKHPQSVQASTKDDCFTEVQWQQSKTSNGFNSFKNTISEVLPDRILVSTVPSMPALSFRDPRDINHILPAYSKILRVLLLIQSSYHIHFFRL